MKQLFQIFYFHSQEGPVSSLLKKLNRNSRIAYCQLLGEKDDAVLQRGLNLGIPINVLVLSDEDRDAVRSWDFSFLNRGTETEKDTVYFIVAGINIPADNKPIIDGADYWPLQDADEDLRRALVQFNNKRLRVCYSFSPFVGRSQELDQFDSLLYSELQDDTRAVIVSGHPGIGREAFVWECARRVMKDPEYEPYTISMGENGNIEMLLVQLNSIRHHFSEAALKEVFRREPTHKVSVAVSLLNEMLLENHCLVIYDDSKSCVRFDRRLSDWFGEVVSHPELQGGMRIFVISTVSVNYRRFRAEDGCSFITLYDLTRADRKKLIYSYLSTNVMSLDEDTVNNILDSAVYSPNILLKMLADIKEKGAKVVIEKKANYEDASAKNLHTVVTRYQKMEDSDAWNLLIYLSKIEYVSESILQSVFTDRYDCIRGHLDMLIGDGLLERFGEWMEYYRLEGSVSDFIRRNKYGYLGIDFRSHVRDVSEAISASPKITEDYSAFLYKIKKDIERGIIDEDALLIPSVLVSTISQTYDAKKWDRVIELCEKVLVSKPQYFPQIKREFCYWYCLALARRKKEDRFYEQVEVFKGSADYFFLKGFYLRNSMQYARAEDAYRTALKMNPSFTRAKRELVNVLQRQHKFGEALDLARENYERDPANSYHMLAYFRCLVRKPGHTHEEIQLLKHFLEIAPQMFRSYSFVRGMQFEYDRFINKKRPDELLPEVSKLEKENVSEANYIKDVVSDYMFAQGMAKSIDILPIDEEIDE